MHRKHHSDTITRSAFILLYPLQILVLTIPLLSCMRQMKKETHETQPKRQIQNIITKKVLTCSRSSSKSICTSRDQKRIKYHPRSSYCLGAMSEHDMIKEGSVTGSSHFESRTLIAASRCGQEFSSEAQYHLDEICFIDWAAKQFENCW